MKLGALFSPKLAMGVQGRKESLERITKHFSKKDKVIWMHAASLGEYEQGLPVLEKLQSEFNDHKVLVTFFSPSGYEVAKKKPQENRFLAYLPFDTPKEIDQLLSAVHPTVFFTVKYDFWYVLFEKLAKKGVPIYVVSALFYPGQVFFSWWGKFAVERLKRDVKWFFHQTQESLDLATMVGLTRSSVSGDTRFDRVRKTAREAGQILYIDEFKGDSPLVVYGSSWEEEENIALAIFQQDQSVKQIIAPHDLSRVPQILKKFPEAKLYSELSSSNAASMLSGRVLIIDSIGMLSRLYQYADIAVVGGGFHSKGLHNILEAAVFGVPVLFGNHYRKNPEADDLVHCKGAEKFSTSDQAVAFIKRLVEDHELRDYLGGAAEKFINSSPVSTEMIVQHIISEVRS